MSILKFTLICSALLGIVVCESDGEPLKPKYHGPDTQPYYWNLDLAKYADSIYKIFINPVGSSGYAGSGFLCAIQLDGAVHTGVHYGFLSNYHAIPAKFIVPTVGANVQLYFNARPEGEKFNINLNNDTTAWFSDAQLDVTFLEVSPKLVGKMMHKGLKFIHLTSENGAEMEQVAQEDGRQVIIFGTESRHEVPMYSMAKLLKGAQYENSMGDIFYYGYTSSGVSGAPVFNDETFQVVGIHKRSAHNYKSGLSIAKLIERMHQIGLKPTHGRPKSSGWILAVEVSS